MRRGLDPRWTGWGSAISHVKQQAPRVDVRFSKEWLPHPLQAGFYPSIGTPKAQDRDFRYCMEDGSGIHVREYRDRYEVHWDEFDPSHDFLGHLTRDAPGALLVGAIVGYGLWKAFGK